VEDPQILALVQASATGLMLTDGSQSGFEEDARLEAVLLEGSRLGAPSFTLDSSHRNDGNHVYIT